MRVSFKKFPLSSFRKSSGVISSVFRSLNTKLKGESNAKTVDLLGAENFSNLLEVDAC